LFQKLVASATAKSLKQSENAHTSTNRENLVQISPFHFDIISLEAGAL